MARLSQTLLLFALLPARAALPPEQVEFFEKKIHPVLSSECVECHGAEKQKGGLRLDYRDGWKKGGDSGDAIVPGDPGKSLFMRSIRHEDPDLAMPSKRPKLTPEVIANFERWIQSGALDPRDEPPKDGGKPQWSTLLEERKSWWSLRPVRVPEIPTPHESAWSGNAIDRFLLAKMDAVGIVPAEDADARSLCRRITYVLTGLPPAPNDVEAFAQEYAAESAGSGASRKCVERLVDRLLASPQFGERWARHWMDLTRYAETHGSEGDPDIPNAWRYRDYLIRGLNDDVPWNQLIREHVAGDLLAQPRWNRAEGWNESILGTAHLRLVEHGYQPVDTRDEQVKVVESQIDVLGKAFQGMTFACARCHDHKFDAVSQRDYYALAGILESSRPAMVTIDTPEILDRNKVELTVLKGKIKTALADAWQVECDRIPDRILGVKSRVAAIDAERSRIAATEKAVTELEGVARGRVLAKRGLKVTHAVPLPIARWDFESSREEFGTLHGRLEGNAELGEGRLKLRGNGHFQTDPLGRVLKEKSLEAWVSLANVDQAGGGVMALENRKGDIFDAIVFAEKTPRLWVAGSDFFRRSQVVKGPEEKPGELVHLVISYEANGRAAIYRNGERYGEPWQAAGNEAATFAPDARILFGLRHSGGKHNGYLTGEIEEARLYDRALSREEAKASFAAGTQLAAISSTELAAAWTAEESERRAKLGSELNTARAALAKLAPDGKDAWADALEDARKNPANPLRSWNPENPAGAEDPKRNGLAWQFREGPGVVASAAGDFTILEKGDRILGGLLPAGVSTGVLTRKHGGIAATAHFKITSDFISVRASGKDAQIRLILDGYPLPNGQIFPRATLNHDDTRWVTMDVKYRKGSRAYLEVVTSEDLTRREKSSATDSWFSVADISFHDSPSPADRAVPIPGVVASAPEQEKAAAFGKAARESVKAWRDGKLSATQHQLLDFLIRRDLLSSKSGMAPEVLRQYRALEGEVPIPRRSTGVMEGDSQDAELLARGDHHKPDGHVPRAYLGVFGGKPFLSAKSGRLELADALVDARNPLTARVMVNRIWLHVFGKGLVATPDNFGKMGELPTHPELLDFLAGRFVEDGWSAKKMLRVLLTTRAFQLASTPSEISMAKDPENRWLSHFPLRRLEAESIRDSLFAISGNLDSTMYGPPVAGNAPRRSIYLGVRRTNLNAFLQTFDTPKPFTTMGRRDSTNVPAQSLALLNDPFVIQCAERWAERHLPTADRPIAEQIRALYVETLSRFPTSEELSRCEQLLVSWNANADPKAAWRDLAQAIFNLKEFVYLR